MNQLLTVDRCRGVSSIEIGVAGGRVEVEATGKVVTVASDLDAVAMT